MKKLILTALAIASIASCAKEAEIAFSDNDNQVCISSSIASRTSGSTWESGDEIGVYMTTYTGTLIGNLGTNALYTCTNSDGTFSATSPLYFPSSGSVDFLAYYPYSSANDFDITAYAVNVNSQSYQDEIDLMSASKTNQAQTTAAIDLEFYHRLSRIQLNIQATTGSTITDEQLKTIEVSLSGLAATADYNLTTNNIGNLGTATDITLLTNSTGTLSEAIIIPQELSSGTSATLFFTIGTTKYSVALPTTKFETTLQYIYNVSVGNVAATISSTKIEPWGAGNGENGENLQAGIYVPTTN